MPHLLRLAFPGPVLTLECLTPTFDCTVYDPVDWPDPHTCRCVFEDCICRDGVHDRCYTILGGWCRFEPVPGLCRHVEASRRSLDPGSLAFELYVDPVTSPNGVLLRSHTP